LTEQKEIDNNINKVNLTPMKCLGYKTPAEVFAELGVCCTCRLNPPVTLDVYGVNSD
jgi:hypothetical protein